MELLLWILGLVAVLAMAAIADVLMKEGLWPQRRRGSRAAEARKRRLSPSRWML